MGKKFFTILLIYLFQASLVEATENKADVLVVPVTTITKFDPYMGNDLSLNKVMNQVASNLVSLDDSLSPVPELARTWSIDTKRQEITFELQGGKTFHDGSVIEPKDIFSVFKRSVNAGSDLTSQLDGFKNCQSVRDCPSFKVLSATKFTLKLADQNFPYLLRKFAGVEGVIYKTSSKSAQFIGSGPYKVKEITQNAIITERIDPDLPLRQIIFKKTLPKKGMEEFSSGAIDLISDIDFEVDEQKLPKSAKRQDKLTVTFGLVFNLTAPSVFQSKEVRRAVSLAIDKSEFLKAYGQRTIPASGLIPKGFLGYQERDAQVDIAAAKALIAKHLPQHQRQIVLGLRHRYKGNRALETDLPAMFAKIGLDLKIEYDNFNKILKDFRKGKYHLIMKGDTPRNYDPSTVFIPYIDGQFQNVSSFKSQRLNDLYYTYEKTIDPKRKVDLLEQMEGVIRDEIPVLPLFYPVLSTWYQENIEIQNFKELSIRFWDFPYHKLSKQLVLNKPSGSQ